MYVESKFSNNTTEEILARMFAANRAYISNSTDQPQILENHQKDEALNIYMPYNPSTQLFLWDLDTEYVVG